MDYYVYQGWMFYLLGCMVAALTSCWALRCINKECHSGAVLRQDDWPVLCVWIACSWFAAVATSIVAVFLAPPRLRIWDWLRKERSFRRGVK